MVKMTRASRAVAAHCLRLKSLGMWAGDRVSLLELGGALTKQPPKNKKRNKTPGKKGEGEMHFLLVLFWVIGHHG